MAKPRKSVSPENRLENWKKLWATPKKLTEHETDDAFDEFADALVPGHMHKLFLKSFGVPKAQFGNRFFVDEAFFQNWDTRLSTMGAGEGKHVEAIVIYGSPEKLEGHWLRGESRRTFRDILVDDWQAACVIVRAERYTFYIFCEPKMRGCIVRKVPKENVAEEEPLAEPTFIEHDEEAE